MKKGIIGEHDSNFKINLTHPIIIDPDYDYKVGLIEMTYTNNLCTFKNDCYKVEDYVILNSKLVIKDGNMFFEEILKYIKYNLSYLPTYDSSTHVTYELELINIYRRNDKVPFKVMGDRMGNEKVKLKNVINISRIDTTISSDFILTVKSVTRRLKVQLTDGYYNNIAQLVKKLNKKNLIISATIKIVLFL